MQSTASPGNASAGSVLACPPSMTPSRWLQACHTAFNDCFMGWETMKAGSSSQSHCHARSAVACRGSLKICYSIRGCRDIVPPHVLVHLWEALPHIVFCTAFSHGSKAKPLGRVVELRRWKYRLAESLASFTYRILVLFVNVCQKFSA